MMPCYGFALAAGVLGFLCRRRASLTLIVMPLASLAVLAGLVQGLVYSQLLLALAAAAIPILLGRKKA